MRGFSFEIRADAKFGKASDRAGRWTSAKTENGQRASDLVGRHSAVQTKKRSGIRGSVRPIDFMRAFAPDPRPRPIRKKLSWGALAKRGPSRIDRA